MLKKIILFCMMLVLLASHAGAEEALKANVIFKLDSVGHVYYTNEKIEVPISYFNNSSSEMTLTTEIKAVGRRSGHEWNYEKVLDLEAYDSFDETIVLDFAEDIGIYDIYDLTVNMTDGSLSSVKTDEFSYVKRGTKNKFFGVNTHFQTIEYKGFEDRAISLMKNSGIGNVRDGVEWRTYETSKGQYAVPADYDETVDKLRANDIDILLTLCYGNALYTKTSQYIPVSTDEVEGFKNYAANLVNDMRGRVNYFEIWNEPNLTGGFNEGGDDGTGYGELVKAVYPVIKSANPDNYVMGYASTGLNSAIDRTAATGASDYMDAASFHPYPEYDSTGKQAWATGKQLPEVTDKYIDRFIAKTGKNKIWITEQGWSDGDNKNSEELQAAYLVRAYTLAMEGGVEKYFWYELFRSAAHGDSHEGKFGMLQSRLYSTPFAARPVYLAMSNMNSKIANASVSDSSITSTYYQCNFDNGVSVIWSTTGETRTVNFGAANVKKTDIYGNETILSSDSGIYEIEAEINPAYYEAYVPIKFEYSYDAENAECKVSGYVDSRQNKIPVNVTVYVPGKGNMLPAEDSVTDTICYFAQAKTDSMGVFEYSFNPLHGEGIYLVKFSSGDGEIFTRSMDLRSKLSCEAEVVGKNLKELEAGEAFSVNVTVTGQNKISKMYDVYLALYSGGKLVGVQVRQNEIARDVVSKITTFDVLSDYKIDEIRAFAWENGMIPISESAELN